MTYQQKKQSDIKYGLEKEKKVIKQLRKKYKFIQEIKNKYSPIDFIDKENKICFELKSTEQGDLESYRFGADKYIYWRKKYKKKGYKFMIIYNINDNIVFKWIKKRKDFRTKMDERRDRGRKEIRKEYCIIERHNFKFFKYQYKKIHILDLDYYEKLRNTCFIMDEEE